MITLIAAVANNGAIGKEGTMPWKLKRDLAYFRENTLNKPIIMGRKTYISLGKPLPKRLNIVLSRQGTLDKIIVTKDLEKALAIAKAENERKDQKETMVIGGGEIYQAFMPLANRLLITHVDASPEGDVFFPKIDEQMWQKRILFNHKKDENNDFDCFFAEYTKVS